MQGEHCFPYKSKTVKFEKLKCHKHFLLNFSASHLFITKDIQENIKFVLFSPIHSIEPNPLLSSSGSIWHIQNDSTKIDCSVFVVLSVFLINVIIWPAPQDQKGMHEMSAWSTMWNRQMLAISMRWRQHEIHAPLFQGRVQPLHLRQWMRDWTVSFWKMCVQYWKVQEEVSQKADHYKSERMCTLWA